MLQCLMSRVVFISLCPFRQGRSSVCRSVACDSRYPPERAPQSLERVPACTAFESDVGRVIVRRARLEVAVAG
jgi:hypothetical protein